MALTADSDAESALRIVARPRRVGIPRPRAGDPVARAYVGRCGAGSRRVEPCPASFNPADGQDAHFRDRAAQTALPAGVRAGVGAVVLGLVLERGVPLGTPGPRSTAVRLCLRHASRLVPPRYLHDRIRASPR